MIRYSLEKRMKEFSFPRAGYNPAPEETPLDFFVLCLPDVSCKNAE